MTFRFEVGGLRLMPAAASKQASKQMLATSPSIKRRINVARFVVTHPPCLFALSTARWLPTARVSADGGGTPEAAALR